MTYDEIFLLGWNLNLIMFLLNFFLAMRAISAKSKEQLEEENIYLADLKNEFDTYYPYRKYETIVTYMIPFTAFFRMSYRLIEMVSFFNKNDNTTMVDFMIYKYQSDIDLAKNRLNN
ncbi:hypothetical protein [Arcobacter sp. LA11]|uniref:hypothetical protein n=1 Tax=Arcobacter sp. LA11 TaxID=1898176 RepID=UPI000932905A|nr:hypothetical protein [Arcobacter sp. LA11]